MYHIALLDFSIQRGYLFTPLRSKYFLQKVAERRKQEYGQPPSHRGKRNRPAHPVTFQGKVAVRVESKDETRQTHSGIGIFPALRPADYDGRIP